MSKLIILLKLKKKQSTARRVAKLTATTTTTRKNVTLTQSALALNTTFVSSLSPPQKSSSTSSILLLSTTAAVSSKSFLQSADLSDTTNATTTTTQQVFNQLEKSRFYSFLNSTSKLNTSDTLEQMYNDNNTFNETFRSSSSSSSSSTNTSTSSIDTPNQKFEITSTNVDSTSSHQLNVKLKSILKPYNVDDINIDVSSSTQPLISNISILKLEQEIRKRINQLRQTAATLKLNVPINLSMLEAMYDLKMDGLKQEARKAIKEFDQKSSNHERHGNMNLNKFFRLIKNLNGKSLRRARSLNSSPNRQKVSSPLSTPEVKHKNYYSFERDNIERKMESRMRSFQYEILFLINDIEAQFKQLKRASRDEAAKAKNASCVRHQARVNQRRKMGTLTKKQRIHYSTEAIIQKRIRIHKCQYAYDKNNNSVQNLTTTELIEKNKNPLAFETMV
jgi:hypothetical protein